MLTKSTLRLSSFYLQRSPLRWSRMNFKFSSQSPMSTSTSPSGVGSRATVEAGNLRKRLTTDLKNAMKAKDTFRSTVLRSVLSDVYAADKTPAGPISDSSIVSILRKSVARRVESASQFSLASRPELADAEQREAAVLSDFIPSPMSSAQVDEVLSRIFNEQQQLQQAPDPKRAMGVLLKAFYSQVDKSLVDSQMIKDKVEALLTTAKK